jgi:hypothetical protein
MRVEPPAGADEAIEASRAAPEAPAPVETTPETNTIAADPAVANEPPIASAAASEPADAFDASDEAVLDMVAMEMAAPDTDEAYEPKLEDADVYESQIYREEIGDTGPDKPQPTTPPKSEFKSEPKPELQTGKAGAGSWEIEVTFASDRNASKVSDAAVEAPVAATALPIVTPLQPEPEPVAEAMPAPIAALVAETMPAFAPSLGSSLLANGIVSRPRAAGPDPLAPIRRMTQSEKIAFFS